MINSHWYFKGKTSAITGLMHNEFAVAEKLVTSKFESTRSFHFAYFKFANQFFLFQVVNPRYERQAVKAMYSIEYSPQVNESSLVQESNDLYANAINTNGGGKFLEAIYFLFTSRQPPMGVVFWLVPAEGNSGPGPTP